MFFYELEVLRPICLGSQHLFVVSTPRFFLARVLRPIFEGVETHFEGC